MAQLKPCLVPGCPERVRRGRCAKHARARRLQRMSTWRMAHREHVREAKCLWYRKNRDMVISRVRAWKAANPERHRAANSEASRNWRLANREKVNACTNRREP